MRTRTPAPPQRSATPPAGIRRPLPSTTGPVRAPSNQLLQRLASHGVRPKLDVSTPGDEYEREADEVADQVMRASEPEKKKPEPTPEPKPEKKRDEKVQRAVEPPKQRDDDLEKLRAKSDGTPASVVPAAVEASVRSTKGGGQSLSASAREFFEPRFGRDFDGVRVHTDANAAAAAREIDARAFTHGRDVYFASGRYQPDTAAGRRLIAHELAHTLQAPGTSGLALHRQDDAAPAADGADVFVVPLLELPGIKSRHFPTYQGWAAGNRLGRARGYSRDAEGDPGQQALWLAQQNLPPADVLQKLDIDLANPVAKEIKVADKPVMLPSTGEQLERVLRIPTWDRLGTTANFQVDHIVELQVAGWPGATHGNLLENMELLDNRSNASAGGSTRLAVRDSIERELTRQRAEAGGATAAVTPADVQDVLDTKRVVFQGVSSSGRGRRSEGDSHWWSSAEIRTGAHLQNAKPVRNVGEAGRADAFALLAPSRTTVLGEYAHPAEQRTITVPESDAVARSRVAGLLIDAIELDANYASVEGTNPVGRVRAVWNLPAGVTPSAPEVVIPLRRHSQYSGFLGGIPGFGAEMYGASPIEFSPPEIQGAQVVAAGQLRPTVPLLGNQPISLRLVGRDIELAYVLEPGAVSLPIPGLTIFDSSVVLFFGTRGLGAEGAIDFGIRQLGSGRLTASIDTERGFAAGGRFLFDTELFDRAEIEVWYRQGAFGGRGTIGIDRPDKVRGIRSAEITAGYDAGVLSASGRVVPSIPGVGEAALSVTHSEADGLLIAGSLALTDGIPGLRGGTLEAQVQRAPEGAGWELRAHGTAQPAIPGVDATITVDYADGAFTAQGTASYARGMLSGSLGIGVTNRVLDDAGTPTNAIGEELRAFGAGQLTVRIAPWLQGTAGVRLLPNAEIELSGEIALPGQLEVFARKQIDKSLFNIAVQAPVFPGIVAEIGGGLSAEAGFGPGVIDQLRLGITYNPAHEEQTHVTGDAHLNVPANAGLRLAVRAGIGLGITGASATGGLEIGGTLGVAGAAEAAVHIDWMPGRGLVLDAEASVYAEPQFRFDVSGYVSVRALGLSVYDNRWQLAEYQFGSNLRVGASFPIHYAEGEPFDLSLDDVELTIPDVDPSALLAGLVEQIA